MAFTSFEGCHPKSFLSVGDHVTYSWNMVIMTKPGEHFIFLKLDLKTPLEHFNVLKDYFQAGVRA